MSKQLKNIIINAIYNSGSWVVNVVIGIIITPYIVKRLNSEGFGIYTLVISLVGYYGLLDLALGQGLIKFIAAYKVVNNKEGIIESINASLIVQSIIGALATILLIMNTDHLIQLMSISTIYVIDAKYCIAIGAISFLISMISGTFSSTLIGLQKYSYIAQINVISNVIASILTLIMLSFGMGIKELILLNGIISGLSMLLYIREVKKNIPYWHLRIKVEKNYLMRLFSFSGYYFISKILNFISNYLIRFIIAYLLGPLYVTFYIVPSKLTNAVSGLLGNAIGVIFPYSSELYSLENKMKIKELYVSGSRVLALIAIPALLSIIVFAKPIMVLWMGVEFSEKSWKILSLISLNSLVGSLTIVPNTIIMGIGKTKLQSIFSIITIIVFFLVVPILTQWWGLEGTIFALIISAIPGIVFVFYITIKIIEVNIKTYLNEVLRPHYIPILMTTLICSMNYFAPQYSLNGKTLIVFGFAYCALYVIIYWKKYSEIGSKLLLLKTPY